MRGGAAIAALLALVCPVARDARAQEFRVYEWEQPYEGWAEPAYWISWVAQSNRPWEHYGVTKSAKNAFTHTAELEYGFTDAFTAELYATAAHAPGEPLRYAETRLALRYHFFQRYSRYFNPAIYLEYIVPTAGFGDPQEFEAKLVLDHDYGDFRLALNPGILHAVSGDSVSAGWKGIFNGSLYWRRFYRVQPGLELYSEFGSLSHAARFSRQTNTLFPSVNIRFAERFIWNIGVGFGLTNEVDHRIVKSIFSYEFPTIRPSVARR
jgi:hypothetical protein